MNIAQALKQKNKLTKQISELKEKLQNNNSYIVGNTLPYNSIEVLEKLNITKFELIELKSKIAIANNSVYPLIYEMSELKDSIKAIKSLNTRAGVVYDRFAEKDVIHQATIGELEKDQQVELMEGRIESIQTELDAFNYTTQI